MGQEEWRFPAHSFILGKTQPTLSALLRTASGSQLEDLNVRLANPEGSLLPESPIILKLPDLQPDVFDLILRWVLIFPSFFREQIGIITTVNLTARDTHGIRYFVR